MPEPSKRSGAFDDLLFAKPEGTGEDLKKLQPGPVLPKEIAGRAANAINLGATGAQLGSFGGAGGSIAGGALGALIGGVMPPSDAPMTDMATTGAEALASRLIPGAGAASMIPRMGRALGIAGATGAGAMAGDWLDQAADFTSEADMGKVGIFTGMTAAAVGLQALRSPMPAVGAAAKRVEDFTGVDIPLSIGERTGKGRTMEQFFGRGSAQQMTLAEKQNAAGLKAIEKILGSEPTVPQIVDIMTGARKSTKDAIKAFKGDPANQLTQQVPSGLFSPTGQPLMKTETIGTDWNKFERAFGISAEARDDLYKVLKSRPAAAIDALVPMGDAKPTGELALRALFEGTLLNNTEKGALGDALVQRIIQRSGSRIPHPEFGDVLSGKDFFKALSDFGDDRLKRMIGADRFNALKDIGMVMAVADPAKKMGLGPEPQTAVGRLVSYIFNKNAFAIQSGAAVGGAGLGAAMGNAAFGSAAGFVGAFTLSQIVNRTMQSPGISKLLVNAAQGDANASTKFVRLMMSQAEGDTEERMEQNFSTLRSRFQGLFQPSQK